MECPRCHRWCPPDPETGYDADDYCPECQRVVEEEADRDETLLGLDNFMERQQLRIRKRFSRMANQKWKALSDPEWDDPASTDLEIRGRM